MSDLRLVSTPLGGLFSLEHRRHEDSRGIFSRLFCERTLSSLGSEFHIKQINHSRTLGEGSVRGLHYQCSGAREAKLITCLQGSVWDVVVDLRAGSPTFLHWHAEYLQAGDGRSILIPAGFAHGFQTLSAEAELLYFHSAEYAPAYESGISAKDPRLNITWPLPIINLSQRDKSHPTLDASFTGVEG